MSRIQCEKKEKFNLEIQFCIQYLHQIEGVEFI